MNLQPDNAECADMFRVMMTTMMTMHPTWRQLRQLAQEMKQDFEAGLFKGKKGQFRLQYRITHLTNVFAAYQD